SALSDYNKVVELDAKVAEKLKTFNRRYVRVVNNTNEPLQVHVQYEELTEAGEWHWYPAAPPNGKPLTVTVEGGKTVLLQDGDDKVEGRRMRIWADGVKSGAK